MANIHEKISYIKGLMEGMEIDRNAGEGKLFAKIIDILDEMAETIGDLSDAQDELSDFVEDINDDLADLEDAIFGDDDEEDDCDCDDCDCDECGCDDCGCDDEENPSYIEFICRNCGNRILYDVDSFNVEADHVCPQCNTPIFTDVEEDDE